MYCNPVVKIQLVSLRTQNVVVCYSESNLRLQPVQIQNFQRVIMLIHH